MAIRDRLLRWLLCAADRDDDLSQNQEPELGPALRGHSFKRKTAGRIERWRVVEQEFRSLEHATIKNTPNRLLIALLVLLLTTTCVLLADSFHWLPLLAEQRYLVLSIAMTLLAGIIQALFGSGST